MKIVFLLTMILIVALLSSCTTLMKKTDNQNINENLDYSAIKDLDLPKDDITLIINNNILDLKTPIYLSKNRYFLCLNDLIDSLGGTLTLSDKTLNIEVLEKDISINTEENKVNISSSKEFSLKEKLINKDKFYYISFFDFSNILNLYTRWDKSSKTLRCKINGDDIDGITPYKSKIDQKAYIRLEDVALTTLPYDNEYLEKLRVLGNYLSKRNVPYHIAWIPHYISPANNVDIDLEAQNDFQRAELIYTLDYLSYHKGVIGLHGYTHQRGNEESAIGSEFGPKFPSVSEFENRIQKAVDLSKNLNIPIDFFETPHYEATPDQNRIAEKYFKILYYPFKDNGQKGIDYAKPQHAPNNKSYYISTYLDYVHENGEDDFINKIENADTKYMGSMFFHPRLDFKHITLTDNNGIPEYIYDDNSIIKRILNAFEKKGYKIDSVKNI